MNGAFKNDFKIIAIRPLEGCNRKHLKILNAGTVYQFYNNYKFKREHVDNHHSTINEIAVDKDILPGIYNIKRDYGDDLNVNISAIVGKNGCGKSSLIELLYVFLYNISLYTGVLSKRDENGKAIRNKVKDINIEVYFTSEFGFIKCLRCNGEDYQIRIFNSENKFVKSNELKHDDLKELFYTISINYSHHALNSNLVGEWIENVFHKNDSYQTPIVINPFRDEGKIDINNEDDLVKSRILANLIFSHKGRDENGLVQLLPDKFIKSLKFSLDISKGNISTGDKKLDNLLKDKTHEIVQIIFNVFNIKSRVESETDDKYLQVAYKYIVGKLYSIHKKYKTFNMSEFEYVYLNPDNSYSINIQKLEALIIEIINNQSHITFKIKQALNFIVNYKREIITSGKYISISDLDDYVNNRRNDDMVIDYVPPSFFKFDIKFNKGRNYSSLSSGEKQRIYSTATMLYHLYNLNSVKGDSSGLTKYTSVNIIFDEVELYYHPEWQRQFVTTILESIQLIHIPFINSLNLIFITHSPFILSDIPSNNILYLKDNGIPESEERYEKTFGANIHEILGSSFFLNQSFIGEFALKIIQKLIAFYEGKNSEFTELTSQELIDSIDDDIVTMRLQDMHDFKFSKTRNKNLKSYHEWLISELKKIKND
jgi:predicted ATP-binding protein involved in virulence